MRTPARARHRRVQVLRPWHRQRGREGGGRGRRPRRAGRSAPARWLASGGGRQRRLAIGHRAATRRRLLAPASTVTASFAGAISTRLRPTFLGPVQRRVGDGDQRLHVRDVVVRGGDAQGRRDPAVSTGPSSTTICSIASRIFSATERASSNPACRRATMNSSPPYRAATSDARMDAPRTRAKVRSASSPAGCP